MSSFILFFVIGNYDFGKVRHGQGQVRHDALRLGPVRRGEVWSGVALVRSGKIRQVRVR